MIKPKTYVIPNKTKKDLISALNLSRLFIINTPYLEELTTPLSLFYDQKETNYILVYIKGTS